MLYHLTKSIIHLALRGFFRKIEVIGEENIPKAGPIMFIANHPSALIDPLIVSIAIKKKLHFIAGAEFFGKGFKSWLLREQYNMIPVYRPKAENGKRVDNTDMFSECYKILNREGAILVFPEGSSVTEKRIRSLKTGTIRILSGFYKTTSKQPVHVIPVGLNYADPHSFKSDVLVKIGAPISNHKLPMKDDSQEAIRSLSMVLEEHLKQEVIHIEDYSLNSLIANVHEILRYNLGSEVDSKKGFDTHKKLVDGVIHFQEVKPEAVQSINNKIDSYFSEIRALGIDHYLLDESKLVQKTSRILLFIGLMPLFAVGLFGNLLPYSITKGIYQVKYRPRLQDESHGQHINPAFSATVSYSIGTLIFLVWFVSISLIAGYLTYWWVGIIAFFSLYLLGQFSAWYRRLGERLIKRWKVRRIFKKNKDKVEELITLRSEIIEELNIYREEFEGA
ncbi:MAG: 1-acyl-sn-glycerol-3-phosphate acyltransferase [Cyclobacteriaceae bacterium]